MTTNLKSRFVLAAIVAVLLIPVFARPASAAPSTPLQPLWIQDLTAKATLTCTVWIGTDYFTDSALTNRVGVCTITCSQFDIVEPTFTGGGTCTGSPATYTLRRFYACPGACR